MRLSVELYVDSSDFGSVTPNYERVDFFDFETIELDSSIQNVKDISKVFTDFSQQFTIPASSKNNRIFKHYYNPLLDNGFDGRRKVKSKININGIEYKLGKIRLDGVDLKKNQPYAYRITFFGQLVELKDLIGDDELDDLDLSAYDLDYDATTIKNKLTTQPSTSNHIIAPLITHTQNLFYDSTSSEHSTDNIYYHSGSGHSHHHGVKWNELKYAIRVNKIIEAIETKYGIQFSTDFFKNTSVREFDELFLWLHRKSGAVENLSGSTNSVTRVDVFEDKTTEAFTMLNSTLSVGKLSDPNHIYTDLRLVLGTNSTDLYNLHVFKDGELYYTENDLQGDQNITAVADNLIADDAVGDYEIYIESSFEITFNGVYWIANALNSSDQAISYVIFQHTSGVTFTNSIIFLFTVSSQMPKMKVLDFLSGLFKLFNLTAYYQDDVLQVKTLDDFYSVYNEYDITKYVDSTESSVNTSNFYNDVTFSFKDTKSFLANKFGELNNRDWGEASVSDIISDSSKLSGSEYKVEVPFGHMLYERLTDENTGEQTDVVYGWSVNEDTSSYLGSPLLFYSALINTYNTELLAGISFINSLDADGNPDGHEEIVFVNTPFNEIGTGDLLQLNFNKEISEWSGSIPRTLFTEYYKDYVTNMFDKKNRLTVVKAVLPLRILESIKLSDRIIINSKRFKINKLRVDLTTGQSDLELLTDL